MQIENYDREERIAIRQFCGGMSEKQAIELTDLDEFSLKSMVQRIENMARLQRKNARPAEIRMPRHEPVHDRKSMAAGDFEDECP